MDGIADFIYLLCSSRTGSIFWKVSVVVPLDKVLAVEGTLSTQCHCHSFNLLLSLARVWSEANLGSKEKAVFESFWTQSVYSLHKPSKVERRSCYLSLFHTCIDLKHVSRRDRFVIDTEDAAQHCVGLLLGYCIHREQVVWILVIYSVWWRL